MARLIPACAGKTRRLWAWRPPSPAHPRACGENVLAASSASSTPGSSPRVRGKRPDPLAHAVDEGLIPARAGKTGTGSSSTARPRAHPRACGENFRRVVNAVRNRGSSPRVRGKPVNEFHQLRVSGLIPARAGKTTRGAPPPASCAAHPRACGENAAFADEIPAALGSSPRVRGKPVRMGRPEVSVRLIPARAGKTPRCSSASRGSAAHPRACGENRRACTRLFRALGSSPRVRGKRP